MSHDRNPKGNSQFHARRTAHIKICCIACVVLGAALAALFLMAAPTWAAGGSENVKLLRVPDGGIQPQIVLDADGTIHLIYFKGTPGAGDVFYVRRRAGEAGFSSPIRVNSQSGSAIAVGSIRGAQIAIGKNNRVHVAWNGSGQAEPKGPAKYKYATPMLYSRLNDAGDAFEPQRNVITTAYTLDGGGSVAADRAGNVYVVWHGNPEADGEGNRRVYAVRSTDDGATFGPETPIDSGKMGVCGCCGLKAFADSQGKVYVLYRSARENVNRDMQLLVSTDGGKSFSSSLVDRWMIAKCPMSSEAFAESSDAVLTAWETDGQVFFSRIDKKNGSAGKSISPPGTGKGRKHPALALNAKGEALVVWDEGTGWKKGGSLAWQIFDAAGKPTTVRGKSDGIPVWSFPAVFKEPEGTFVVVY